MNRRRPWRISTFDRWCLVAFGSLAVAVLGSIGVVLLAEQFEQALFEIEEAVL